MTTLAKERQAGFLQRRLDRVIETGNMTVSDALVFGVADMFGMTASIQAGCHTGVNVNAPLYEGEPSTWCGRCKQPYWSARCPVCGK